jgi:hypothetical protein
VTVEWSPRAITTASRFLTDRAGMTAVVDAIDALETDPYPLDSFAWGDNAPPSGWPVPVMYVIEGDLITIDRVDRVSG